MFAASIAHTEGTGTYPLYIFINYYSLMHRAVRSGEKNKNANIPTARCTQGELPWNEKRICLESMTSEAVIK